MSNQQPCRDTFYDIVPERMWLRVTNIGVRASGMVKVILEVNGQDKVLYDSYVIDGTVSHEFNLTSWLQNARIKSLEAQIKQGKQLSEADNKYIRKLERAVEAARDDLRKELKTLKHDIDMLNLEREDLRAKLGEAIDQNKQLKKHRPTNCGSGRLNMGCGGKFEDWEPHYKCVDCGTDYHKHCLRKTCGSKEERESLAKLSQPGG